MTETEPKSEGATQRFSVREKALCAIAIAAAVLAILGFGLFFANAVPASAAAKVNDFYVEEADVSDWIYQYRSANGLLDDTDFASALLSQDLNVSTFRESAINQLALSQMVNDRAAELGIEITDEAAQEQLEATKETYAFGDDDTWAETLETYGLTEEGLLEQYKTNLAKEAVLEADVEYREATDEELLSYVQEYLAGTTQKHAMYITFEGDDASERASECYEQLQALDDAGNLNDDTFSELALEYSDADGVDETLGDYAWSGAYMSDDAKEVMEYMAVGEYGIPEELDGVTTILYCDDEYAFPEASEIESLPEDVPDALLDEVYEAACTDYVWQNDCDAYLAYLLLTAKTTYYPIPDDADYFVDITLAGADALSEAYDVD